MSIYAITLAFANAELLERSINAFYATRNPAMPLTGHYVVHQHYPLRPESIGYALDRMRLEHGVHVIDPERNLGLHEGFNWAMRQIKPKDDDIIIGYDGDSLPLSKGWDMALVRAIDGSRSDGHGSVVWATLGNPRTLSDVYSRGYDTATADGYLRLFLTRTAITNSICAWRYGWLRRVGFLQEPRAYYGHLEAAMFNKLGKGERWAVLPDWIESDELRGLHDREYVIYKWRHSHLNDWPGDFKSFVEAGCPESGATPTVIP